MCTVCQILTTVLHTRRFRRWFHLIPLKGPASVQRRRVRKAKGDAQFLRQNRIHAGAWYLEGKVKIKKLRRVVTEGTLGRLWASEWPCCEATCVACSGRAERGHAHRACQTFERVHAMALLEVEGG